MVIKLRGQKWWMDSDWCVVTESMPLPTCSVLLGDLTLLWLKFFLFLAHPVVVLRSQIRQLVSFSLVSNFFGCRSGCLFRAVGAACLQISSESGGRFGVRVRDISLEHSTASMSMNHELGGSDGEKVLLNGDVYVGSFDDSLPHGVGTYTWLDGIIYDGQWEKSKITGRGKICWPSGATYDREFCGGFLHGSGTLFGVDGSVYIGLWRMNKQHGIGIKTYSNLDEYDGLWREGWQDGHGTYKWSNGDTYTGNWKAGKMYGKGVMKWANGDIFFGDWSDGLENGSGCYNYVDGSIYVGIWSKGLKDGHGTFFPSGSKLPSQLRFSESVLCENKVQSPSHSLSYSAEGPVRIEDVESIDAVYLVVFKNQSKYHIGHHLLESAGSTLVVAVCQRTHPIHIALHLMKVNML